MSYRKHLVSNDIAPSEMYEATAVKSDTDTISRKAAIDALTKDEYGEFWDCIDGNVAADIIRRLPSAQSEIIRCKDCKHWIPYDWMFSEVWQSRNINDYPEDEIGCDCSDMAMKANDFCSHGERRDDMVTCDNCRYSEKYVDGLILCRRTKTSFRVSATSTCGKGKREVTG